MMDTKIAATQREGDAPEREPAARAALITTQAPEGVSATSPEQACQRQSLTNKRGANLEHSHRPNRIQLHWTALNGSQLRHATSRFSITAGQSHDRPHWQ
jgi:hypothetical protein